MKYLSALVLFICAVAGAQTTVARYDNTASTILGAPQHSGLPQLLGMANVQVNLCTYPVDGGICSGVVTTYTDATLTTPCPADHQIVQATETVCGNTTDAQGNFGFWYNSTVYKKLGYTIIAKQGTFGPFPIYPAIVSGVTVPVTSVFGRTGSIIAQAGDYICAQVTGSICSLPTVYYQGVKVNGATISPARNFLNLINGSGSVASCADNPGSNSTDCQVSLPVPPTIYYQGIKANGVPILPPRGSFNLVGGTGTTVACADNGIGNSTDCQVSLSNADYYFNFTTCTIAQTGNTYSCQGTYSGDPFPLPNNNYSIQCQDTVLHIAGHMSINATSLPTANLPYTWNQSMGNGTSGAPVGGLMSCHIHML